ncbi:hypothetical protein J437_LFUL003399 [Ladona fulva]|uniref:Uncharacterized protein n=1 Tax=Ladona fulva TaxID=123851 RepID=A0A8K0NZI2_LADFU|nr:hypothetical protein J437_LFUL003399 [Ladona fulva]
MGSIPQLSILKGETVKFTQWKEIHRLFEDYASRASPGDVAIVFNGKRTTFSELESSSNKLARSLVTKANATDSSLGPDGEPLVAVCMHPSDRLVTLLMACWKAGAAYVPLDPTFPPTRVTHILSDSRPFLVVKDTGIELDTEIPECGAIPCVTFDNLSEESRTLPDTVLKEGEAINATELEPLQKTAIILYTSGSTGAPKGVKIPHRAVLNRLNWQWRAFPFSDEERIATCLKTALTFVDSVSELLSPLLQGRGVLVAPKATTRNPEDLLRLLAENGVKRLILVPSLLRAILLCVKPSQSGVKPPIAAHANSIKLWVCSGEILPLQLLKDFFIRFPRSATICNFYGSTEVMGDVTFQTFNSMAEVEECENTVPIGRPLDNTLIYLLDKQFRPVPLGEMGELFASGLNVAKGYVQSKEADRFCRNPFATDLDHALLYRTGDFAKIIKGGVISYEGRSDSQIKVRGHRVDLVEVERALTGLDGLDKAVVLCYRPGHIDQAIVAFVTSEDHNISAKDIESKLQKVLPPYMIPEPPFFSQVMKIDKIPLLVNGKTDRQALLKKYEEDMNSEEEGKENECEPDLSMVPDYKRAAAVSLFQTVEHVLRGTGAAASTLPGGILVSKEENCCKRRRRGQPITLESNFYEIGGNSLNSVYTVMRLRDQGYIIGISDFVTSRSLGEILNKLHSEEELALLADKSKIVKDDEISPSAVIENGPKFIPEKLSHTHKDDVYKMITSSFYQKADLEQWLMPGISVGDYHDLLDKLWEPLLKADYSFVVKSLQDNTYIGVALNFDLNDEPQIELTSKLSIVFEFLEKLEDPIRTAVLPKDKGKALYSFMMGTDESLPYQKNVEVIQFMEEEVIRTAKRNNFEGVFTTNTNPLTQQLCTDVNQYKVLLDYQVNLYVAPDGSKPFGKAPSSQRATCSWKSLKGV